MIKRNTVKNIALSALFLALGFVLPFFTGQIQVIGNMLLPMHIPVMLCGLLCGWQYGGAVGFILPLLRSALFSMPPFYPSALAMAFELAAYGLLMGLFYHRSKWQCIRSLYRSLVFAMLGGRIVWGAAMTVLMGVKGNLFTLSAFWAGAFLNAIPGIVLQLVLIPAIMVALDKTKLVHFSKGHSHKKQDEKAK